jgi:predicted NUDIX family phosphoesterase
MGKMDEIIIVAPRSEVFQNETLNFQGTMKDKEVVDTIMKNINDSFTLMRRGDAEEDPRYKQPIPYAVIQRGNEIFVYERLKGAGETRLHNKLSLGVGGHMNAVEGKSDFKELLTENLLREIEEELNIDEGMFEVKTIGLINDDYDEVGRVHIGVLVTIRISEEQDVTVRETEELAGKFMALEELKKKEVYDRLENWSKIVVDIL